MFKRLQKTYGRRRYDGVTVRLKDISIILSIIMLIGGVVWQVAQVDSKTNQNTAEIKDVKQTVKELTAATQRLAETTIELQVIAEQTSKNVDRLINLEMKQIKQKEDND